MSENVSQSIVRIPGQINTTNTISNTIDPKDLYIRTEPRIRFCPECNNMLYPRQNKITKTMVYFCRTCLYQKETTREESCVYVNKIRHEINELTLIPPEMIEDPTLARTRAHPCPKCSHIEAVFMQGLLKESNDAMKLYYICCNSKCKFKWTE